MLKRVMGISRFIAKRKGLCFVVKDNVNGEIVGTLHHNAKHKDMAEKYAKAAAEEFNRLAAERIEIKRRYDR